MSDRAWMDLGACAGKPSVCWFPDIGESFEYARLICSGCVVQSECLEYALRHQIMNGIWGGASPATRGRMRRRIAA